MPLSLLIYHTFYLNLLTYLSNLTYKLTLQTNFNKLNYLLNLHHIAKYLNNVPYKLMLLFFLPH